MTPMFEQAHLSEDDLRQVWPVLSGKDRIEGFRLLPREDAEDFFLSLTSLEQAEIILGVPERERRLWSRQLDPDDAADVIQAASTEDRPALLNLLEERTRREAVALLAYDEDEAGGLMSPRFARVRADSTVDEAIRYLRQQARNNLETIYYAYVLDTQQHLVGVVSFREMFAAPGDSLVRDIMQKDVVSVADGMDQEEVARLMSVHDLISIPVIDEHGVMKGIITYDDIVDVIEEETTEDMQKMSGMEALDTPYFQTGILKMVRKRGAWLSILLVGEMLTASAMSHYENDIAQAIILTLFVPLIISSGGNSGSQATTLIIRAMALEEVRLKDWWRVVWRELISGLLLGGLLAVLGLARVVIWEEIFHGYGPHAGLVGITVGLSLVGVVTWGTLTGSLLPFLFRRLGFDPASASAPFVATLVDVFGLIIYFSLAQIILKGTLL